MSFEPSFDKVVSNYRKRIGEMQTQIECKLPITEEGNAEKILCANVKVGSINTSQMQNVISFDGCAMIQVVYLSEAKEFNTCDYSLEFKDKYMANGDIDAVEVIACSDVIDVRTSIEGNFVRVNAILNVTFDGIFADKVKVLTSAGGEGVFVKYEDIDFANFIGVAGEKFDSQFDVEIVDAVDRVLSVCPTAYLDRVEAYDNYVKVFGGVYVCVTYITSGDKQTIRTYDNTFDFTQEIALSSVTPLSLVFGKISTVYENLGITTNLDQDKSVVSLTVPVDFKGYVYNNCNMQIVSDIYSTDNYLNISTQSFTRETNFSNQTFSEHIQGSVTLDDNDLFIDEILGNCCSDVVIANSRIAGDFLIVDGIASTTVLYRNNETNSVVSYNMQVPFSIDLRVGDMKSDTEHHICAKLNKVSVKARRGVELEFSGDVLIYSNFMELGKEAVIESVELSDEKNASDCNLIIYIAKEGDTVWNIAKEMSVSEEVILAQNPDLTLPIEAGTKIIVYRQSYANIN